MNNGYIVVDEDIIHQTIFNMVDRLKTWQVLYWYNNRINSFEKGYVGRALIDTDAGQLSLRIDIEISETKMRQLKQWTNPSRLFAYHVVRSHNNHSFPMVVKVQANNGSKIRFRRNEYEDDVDNYINIDDLTRRGVSVLLHKLNMPEFFARLERHFYHNDGICIHNIVEEIEQTKVCFTNDEEFEIEAEMTDKWTFSWIYTAEGWSRVFMHSCAINPQRYLLPQDKNIMNVLDRLVSIPINEMKGFDSHDNIIKNIAKANLNAF